jgi:DNA-binding transcriptional LysR family regulator
MVDSLLGEEGLMGELTIGAVPTTLTGLIPRSLSALRTDYPDLHIRVVPGLSAELLPQVERGALDAAILTEPPNVSNYLNWQPFAEEPLVVLASQNIPSDDPIYLLENYPYIRFTRRAWVGMLVDRWLQGMNLKVRESMVAQNLGVSIVPQRCVPPPMPLELKRIPLGPSAKPRILGVISRNDCVKFRIVNALLAELTRSVEEAGQVKAIRP